MNCKEAFLPPDTPQISRCAVAAPCLQGFTHKQAVAEPLQGRCKLQEMDEPLQARISVVTRLTSLTSLTGLNETRQAGTKLLGQMLQGPFPPERGEKVLASLPDVDRQ